MHGNGGVELIKVSFSLIFPALVEKHQSANLQSCNKLGNWYVRSIFHIIISKITHQEDKNMQTVGAIKKGILKRKLETDERKFMFTHDFLFVSSTHPSAIPLSL